jgi:hypothetical protein
MGRRRRRWPDDSGDTCRGGSSAAAIASRVEERVRARKEEESDFTSSIGHNGEGIRVTGRLEAVGGARGFGKPQRDRNPRAATVQTKAVGSCRRWRGRTAPSAFAVKGITLVGWADWWHLGPVGHRAGPHSEGGRPVYTISFIHFFSNKFQSSGFKKYKSLSYLTPKISKFGKLMDKLKKKKHHFWLNFQFSLDFEL